MVKNWPKVSGTLAVTTAFIAVSVLVRTPLTIATETSLAEVVLVADDQVGLVAVAPLRAARLTPAVVATLGVVAGIVAHDGGVGGEVGTTLERNLDDRPASGFEPERAGAQQNRQHEREE